MPDHGMFGTSGTGCMDLPFSTLQVGYVMLMDQFYEIVGGKLTGFKGGTKWNKAETALIPEGVTEICAFAFPDCRELLSAVIPDGVAAI